MYAQRLGVKIDELFVSQTNTGEEPLEIVEVVVRSSAVEIIVVDSVAALVPQDEIVLLRLAYFENSSAGICKCLAI